MQAHNKGDLNYFVAEERKPARHWISMQMGPAIGSGGAPCSI